MCYEEGDWQSYLDEEVCTKNRKAMSGHLADCLICRRRLALLRDNQEFVTGKLAAFMATEPVEGGNDPLVRSGGRK